MRFIQRLAAALSAAFACLGASATSFSTDFSDLWSVLPAEDGWGVNVVQQGDTLFITLFVYGPDNKPAWYVGPATRFKNVAPDNALVFEGILYSTTGPWFGAPVFDPAAVQGNPEGLVQFAASDINQAKLMYSVGETVVTKSVRRQSWSRSNLSGSYRGASLATYAGCAASENGYREHAAVISVVHPGAFSQLTLREETAAYSCDYTGTYTQAGRMGQINANGTCTDGRSPTFLATEVEVTFQGISMRYLNDFGGACTAVGRLGGIRRAAN